MDTGNRGSGAHGALFEGIAPLAVEIDGYELLPLQQDTGGGWTRLTTVVSLRGGGLRGCGEDVTYADQDQNVLREKGAHLPLAGRYTFEEFSQHLQGLDLFPVPPGEPGDKPYRTWAFESAALDLGLRQAARSLADALGRNPQPVSFVVSTGLGGRATVRPLERILELYPGSGFKVDLSASWTEELVADLARNGRVRVVDLKGQYRGLFQGPPANSEQYRWVAEGLPHVWIEDPELNRDTEAALEGHLKRITWDANLHSVGDILALPFKPACINVKASRFGTVRELLAVYEHCMAEGIAMYGGGQFELGPGRGQNQYLASLFHADAPNDVAPTGFNERALPPDLPGSPLQPSPSATGFAWG